MTYDEARNELQKYQETYYELEDLYELLERLDNSSKCKAMRYDKIQVKSSGKTDLSSSIAKIDDIKNMYSKNINENLEYIKKIESKIDKIENKMFKIILRNKYIHNQRLEKVCVDMHYSISYMKKILASAILEYAKIF